MDNATEQTAYNPNQTIRQSHRARVLPPPHTFGISPPLDPQTDDEDQKDHEVEWLLAHATLQNSPYTSVPCKHYTPRQEAGFPNSARGKKPSLLPHATIRQISHLSNVPAPNEFFRFPPSIFHAFGSS